jgi:hypothetical protein
MSIMSIESHEVNDDPEDDKAQKTQAEVQEEYTKRIVYFHESYQRSALKNDVAEVSRDVQPIKDEDVQQN